MEKTGGKERSYYRGVVLECFLVFIVILVYLQ